MQPEGRKSTKYCNECNEEYHIDELETQIINQSLPGCRKQVYLCPDCR
jgi:hypothetical protein